MYEFSVNGTQGLQKSIKYGQISVKRSRLRKNENSSEFLLIWEQNYTKSAKNASKSGESSATDANTTGAGNASGAANGTNGTTLTELPANGTLPKGKKFDDSKFNQTGLLEMNKTEKIRATARISINDIDNFVKFDVSINDVPIELDRSGKDIVVDWFLMDDFDTNNTFWVDSNGLEMVNKQLYQRKDYNYSANGTVSGNYYPVTSAIAVRDHNVTMPGKKNGTKGGNSSNSSAGASAGNSTNSTSAAQTGAKRDLEKKQKQVVIMNDRSQGGSAGLRGGKNIEFMQHRRFRKKDNYGVNEYLNDIDGYGKGIQVASTYYM